MDTIDLGRPARVWIDAGHGGSNVGAISHGLSENALNLEIAFCLEAVLRANGHTVEMTRRSDTYVDNELRGCRSVNWGAELFLSIHHNAYDGASRGVEAFAHRATYVNGMHLALRCAQAIHQDFGLPYHGEPAKQHWLNLGIFEECRNAVKVTCTLIECLFIDNDRDAQVAAQLGYAEKMAEAIAKGVHRHLGLPDPACKPQTAPIKIVNYTTGLVVAEYRMVPNGNHIGDQGKLYVRC